MTKFWVEFINTDDSPVARIVADLETMLNKISAGGREVLAILPCTASYLAPAPTDLKDCFAEVGSEVSKCRYTDNAYIIVSAYDYSDELPDDDGK